jgi:hypothetical protein
VSELEKGSFEKKYRTTFRPAKMIEEYIRKNKDYYLFEVISFVSMTIFSFISLPLSSDFSMSG